MSLRLAGVGTAASIAALGLGAQAAAADTGLTEKVASQIAALQKVKRSLSPVERKLDSRLVVTLRRRAGATRIPRAARGAPVSGEGTTVVDVEVAEAGPDLLKRLQRTGARVVSHAGRTVQARMPLGALKTVASWRGVERVSVATGRMTHAVVSEGDAAHAAGVARTRSHVTGVGTKVCVLSDGVDSLAASRAAGELPVVDVLEGQEGSGDEGAAMLEIVHDIAPNAALGFATAFESEAGFAANIRALRFQARCDILVDDVLYFDESPFQDGPVARAVTDVVADGARYFSSAGNEGNTLDGTSGSYEGDFADSGRSVGKFAGAAHDFDPGPGVQVFEPISPDSSADVPVTLFWADPLGAAADDYDLYLFDGAGNVVGFSQDVQDGDDDPYEIPGTPASGGDDLRLAVVRFSGQERYLQLSALRGRFSDLEPGDPANPAGPFPGAFTAAQLPERFTSDGPRRMFFAADGTPIAGGEVRQKPDITAADGVSTSLEDFTPFFGTSAAAPHAAAIAALVLSGNPGATTDELRDAFDATALDLAPAGVDGRTGSGVIRADRVLAYTGATPPPLVRAGSPTVTPVTGDGDAFLEPGESATVALPVTNAGDGTATGISVTVTTSDPQATLTPRNQSYGNLAAGATRSRGFRLALPASYPLGKRVPLAVRVTFAGVLSPTATTLTIPTGKPAAAPTTFAYAGPPVAIQDNSPSGASVTIPVSGFGYAGKITFSIDGATCTTAAGASTVGLDHTFAGDLTGTLTAPDGTHATLFARRGGGGNNLCQVVFDDAAATPFATVASGMAPFTGSWQPADPLAPLIAGPADGDWIFKVVDAARLDTGSVRAVSLHLTGFDVG